MDKPMHHPSNISKLNTYIFENISDINLRNYFNTNTKINEILSNPEPIQLLSFIDTKQDINDLQKQEIKDDMNTILQRYKYIYYQDNSTNSNTLALKTYKQLLEINQNVLLNKYQGGKYIENYKDIEMLFYIILNIIDIQYCLKSDIDTKLKKYIHEFITKYTYYFRQHITNFTNILETITIKYTTFIRPVNDQFNNKDNKNISLINYNKDNKNIFELFDTEIKQIEKNIILTTDESSNTQHNINSIHHNAKNIKIIEMIKDCFYKLPISYIRYLILQSRNNTIAHFGDTLNDKTDTTIFEYLNSNFKDIIKDNPLIRKNYGNPNFSKEILEFELEFNKILRNNADNILTAPFHGVLGVFSLSSYFEAINIIYHNNILIFFNNKNNPCSITADGTYISNMLVVFSALYSNLLFTHRLLLNKASGAFLDDKQKYLIPDDMKKGDEIKFDVNKRRLNYKYTYNNTVGVIIIKYKSNSSYKSAKFPKSKLKLERGHFTYFKFIFIVKPDIEMNIKFKPNTMSMIYIKLNYNYGLKSIDNLDLHIEELTDRKIHLHYELLTISNKIRDLSSNNKCICYSLTITGLPTSFNPKSSRYKNEFHDLDYELFNKDDKSNINFDLLYNKNTVFFTLRNEADIIKKLQQFNDNQSKFKITSLKKFEFKSNYTHHKNNQDRFDNYSLVLLDTINILPILNTSITKLGGSKLLSKNIPLITMGVHNLELTHRSNIKKVLDYYKELITVDIINRDKYHIIHASNNLNILGIYTYLTPRPDYFKVYNIFKDPYNINDLIFIEIIQNYKLNIQNDSIIMLSNNVFMNDVMVNKFKSLYHVVYNNRSIDLKNNYANTVFTNLVYVNSNLNKKNYNAIFINDDIYMLTTLNKKVNTIFFNDLLINDVLLYKSKTNYNSIKFKYILYTLIVSVIIKCLNNNGNFIFNVRNMITKTELYEIIVLLKHMFKNVYYYYPEIIKDYSGIGYYIICINYNPNVYINNVFNNTILIDLKAKLKHVNVFTTTSHNFNLLNYFDLNNLINKHNTYYNSSKANHSSKTKYSSKANHSSKTKYSSNVNHSSKTKYSSNVNNKTKKTNKSSIYTKLNKSNDAIIHKYFKEITNDMNKELASVHKYQNAIYQNILNDMKHLKDTNYFKMNIINKKKLNTTLTYCKKYNINYNSAKVKLFENLIN